MVLNLSKLQSDSLPLLMLWVAYKGAFKNGMFTKFADYASSMPFLLTFTIFDILVIGAIFTGLIHLVREQYGVQTD